MALVSKTLFSNQTKSFLQQLFPRRSDAVFCIAKRSLANGTFNSAASIRPRRSLLFVPADDAKKINKASKLQADCIILECEDGVAINQKV